MGNGLLYEKMNNKGFASNFCVNVVRPSGLFFIINSKEQGRMLH